MTSLGHQRESRRADSARSPGPTTTESTALGRGFLTGMIDETKTFGGNDNRGTLPRLTPEARKANRSG
jgi:hypothetical protein